MRSIIRFVILVLILLSCSSPHSRKKISTSIIQDGELVVSVFKKDFKNNRGSYHIWTKYEKKNKEQVDSIRSTLSLFSNYTIYLYSDSTLDEGHYYAYSQEYFKNNPIQKFARNHQREIYVENEDTIMLLSSEPDGIYNFYTNKRLAKEDVSFIEKAIKALKINGMNTAFLYEEKTGNPGEEYYGYYYNNGKNITIKASLNENIESTIKDLNEGIKINSIASVILFQDQIRKGKKLLLECDNKTMRDKLQRSLSNFQKINFPLARKMYYNNAKEKLWEKNIEVKLSGRDITFVGYMFADNATIKTTYEEVRQELEDLRFKTVGFRWYEGGDGAYWKLNVKNDGDI